MDFGSLVLLVKTYPLLALVLLIVLDTAFGIVPIEISVIYGLAIGLSPLELGIVGMVCTIIGGLIDYFIGYHGIKIFHVKEKEIEHGKEFFRKYGSWGLVAIRLIPFFPSKPINLLAGAMKYTVALFSAYTAIGSFLRFYLESLLFVALNVTVKSEVALKKAYYHATSPSHYLLSLLGVVAVIAAYYLLIMRRNNKSWDASEQSKREGIVIAGSDEKSLK